MINIWLIYGFNHYYINHYYSIWDDSVILQTQLTSTEAGISRLASG